MTKPSICIIHCLVEKTSPDVVRRDVVTFAQLSQYADVTFVNALGPGLTSIENQAFDLVIVSDSFMVFRSSPYWNSLVKRIATVLSNAARRVLFLQDDYVRLDKTVRFARKYDVIVYSVFSDIDELYANSKVVSRPWLIGFADHDMDQYLQTLLIPWDERKIDIGQRVTRTTLEFGSEGRKKAELAEKFREFATDEGFTCDISTLDEDRFSGDEWFKFLANARSTIGRQSGASLITRSPWLQVHATVIESVYEEEPFNRQIKRLLGRRHKEVPLLAPSPRIFEGASLQVLQILESSQVSYGIEPWIHFVPIEHDFSNIDIVFDFLKSSEAPKMAKNCYFELFGNPKWSREQWIKNLAEENGLQPSPVTHNITVPNVELDTYKILRDEKTRQERLKLLDKNPNRSEDSHWSPIEAVHSWKPVEIFSDLL